MARTIIHRVAALCKWVQSIIIQGQYCQLIQSNSEELHYDKVVKTGILDDNSVWHHLTIMILKWQKITAGDHN